MRPFRTIPLVLLILLHARVPLAAQLKPVAGTPLEIRYTPDPSGPLASSGSLFLVYVFNYWGTRTGTRLALLENVLRPDTTRVRQVTMTRTATGWTASIDVPETGAVLSYFITDGNRRDDNAERTYTAYVYGQDGRPTVNARFFMTHFLELARAGLDLRVRESESEIRDYPENYKAYTQYFSLLFELEKGSGRARNTILDKLRELESSSPENADVLNLIAHTHYYILRDTETGLQYKNRIGITHQWPDVVLMFDRERTMEQQRRVAEDRKQRREALLNTQVLNVEFLDYNLRRLPLRADSGSVQVVTFWATASEQSKRMFEPLERMLGRYAGKPLKILLVNVDPDHKVAAEFLKDRPMPFEQRINFGSNLINLGVDGIPHTMVIDRNGFLRDILIGYTAGTEAELEAAVARMF